MEIQLQNTSQKDYKIFTAYMNALIQQKIKSGEIHTCKSKDVAEEVYEHCQSNKWTILLYREKNNGTEDSVAKKGQYIAAERDEAIAKLNEKVKGILKRLRKKPSTKKNMKEKKKKLPPPSYLPTPKAHAKETPTNIKTSDDADSGKDTKLHGEDEENTISISSRMFENIMADVFRDGDLSIDTSVPQARTSDGKKLANARELRLTREQLLELLQETEAPAHSIVANGQGSSSLGSLSQEVVPPAAKVSLPLPPIPDPAASLVSLNTMGTFYVLDQAVDAPTAAASVADLSLGQEEAASAKEMLLNFPDSLVTTELVSKDGTKRQVPSTLVKKHIKKPEASREYADDNVLEEIILFCCALEKRMEDGGEIWEAWLCNRHRCWIEQNEHHIEFMRMLNWAATKMRVDLLCEFLDLPFRAREFENLVLVSEEMEQWELYVPDGFIEQPNESERFPSSVVKMLVDFTEHAMQRGVEAHLHIQRCCSQWCTSCGPTIHFPPALQSYFPPALQSLAHDLQMEPERFESFAIAADALRMKSAMDFAILVDCMTINIRLVQEPPATNTQALVLLCQNERFELSPEQGITIARMSKHVRDLKNHVIQLNINPAIVPMVVDFCSCYLKFPMTPLPAVATWMNVRKMAIGRVEDEVKVEIQTNGFPEVQLEYFQIFHSSVRDLQCMWQAAELLKIKPLQDIVRQAFLVFLENKVLSKALQEIVLSVSGCHSHYFKEGDIELLDDNDWYRIDDIEVFKMIKLFNEAEQAGYFVEPAELREAAKTNYRQSAKEKLELITSGRQSCRSIFYLSD